MHRFLPVYPPACLAAEPTKYYKCTVKHAPICEAILVSSTLLFGMDQNLSSDPLVHVSHIRNVAKSRLQELAEIRESK